MFSRKECMLFYVAALLVVAGYLLAALDPVEYGFGVATLWLCPLLLLVGFAIPVFAIAGRDVCRPNLQILFRSRHIAGFVVFAVALGVYCLTLEPTASLWDCSEFIASAYKLQVPHTPGTPLSLLIGRVFSMLSWGDSSRVAFYINLMSACFSALAVYVLYYLIVYFNGSLAGASRHRETITVVSSAAGALVLAFSDTFWFSAVEAETYGPASFVLLVLVSLIVRGRNATGAARTRRLMLISYIAGLSYCIHPMCLLALTILPFNWTSAKSASRYLLVIGLGLVVVFYINRFIAVGLFSLAFSIDLFVVNRLGLPFYSGVIMLIAVGVFAVKFLMRYTRARPYVMSTVFLVLGFAPYLMLFIRSNHNPPIDETNPENLPLINAYMNREGYPTAPLLYGPYFDARIVDVAAAKTVYYKGDEGYQVAGTIPKYRYDSRQTLFPRIYSSDADHIEAYRSWLGIGERTRPGMKENLEFMFTYQLGHMYMRYLLWNFAGRESDVQNSGWLAPWQSMTAPAFDRARNQYWMIPLVLGILGAVFQWRRDGRKFMSVLIFYLVTGVVLALYLNSPPIEPRERDYIYVGSFIAFSIWVGIGLTAISAWAGRAGAIIAMVLGAAVPLWMLLQNYNDHDRSGRTFHVDNARNVLDSCAPNSILFTGGDNDTFPLWYLQEVEGFRTDVRVMVLSYMNTDWYINQLRKTYYDSGAFALTLTEDDYRQYGPNDVLYVQETISGAIDFKQYLHLLKKEHTALRRVSARGDPYHILPSRTITLAGGVNDEEVVLRVDGNYMSKNVLAILDLVASNGWERPVYFNPTSLNTLGVDISRYVIQEGLVYRLRPEPNPGEQVAMDTSLMYANLIVDADYSNLGDPSIYFHYEDHFTRIIVPVRHHFNNLATAFLQQENKVMASKVMRYAVEWLYRPHLRPSYTNIDAAELLLVLGETRHAERLAQDIHRYYVDRVESARRAHRTPSNLDIYLLKRSKELLSEMNESSPSLRQ